MLSYQRLVDEQPIYATLQNVACSQGAEVFDPFGGMNAISTGDSVYIEPTMAEIAPYLSIIEQPANTFRYRYKSENGCHGGIKGESATRSKKSYPTVKVENCPPSLRKKIVIKATLYTNELKQNPHQPHPYELTGKNADGVKVDENFTAVFKALEITTRKREEVIELLKERIREDCASVGISYNEAILGSKALELMKSITLDSARLCFEAFSTDDNTPLCEKVFSNPINNQKSAATGDLKIAHLSHYSGEWSGGLKMILLCDKIKKEDIQVRFFDESGWEAFGEFSPADIHHQFAILFKTPAYSKAVEVDTQKVWVELCRPSDNERSPCRGFEYTPNKDFIPNRLKFQNDQAGSQIENEVGVNPMKRKRPNSEDDVGYPINSSVMDSPQSMDDESSIVEDLQNFLASNIPGVDWYNDHFDLNEIDDLPGLPEDAILPQGYMHPKVVADGLGDISSSMDSLSFNDCFKKKLEKSKTQKASNDFIVGMKRILQNRNESTYLRYVAHLIPLLDEDGNSLLHLAIMEQSSNLNLILKMLEVASEDVINHQNNFKETALHLAVKGNNVIIIFLLLARGGDPNVVDRGGNNCLHLAAKLGHINCLKVLVPSLETRPWKRKISDIDALNYDGMTALHLAVTQNSEDCMNYLLNSKADVNLCEKKSGRTSLHLAINHPHLLKGILKQQEVDVFVEDFGGNTPVQLACTKYGKSFEIVSAQLEDNENEILKFLENLSQDGGECRRLSETESVEDGKCSETESDGESSDSSEFEDAVEHFSPTSSQPLAKKTNLTRTEDELRQYLDRDENWRKLADFIGLDCEHVAMFDRGLSPSQTVLRKIEVQHSDLYPSDPLQTVIVGLLKVAELDEGVTILERNS